MASDLKKKVQDTVSSLTSQASTVASTAASKVSETASRVGEKVSTMAGSLRDKVTEGPLGDAAGAVAQQWQAGRDYLREHDVADLGREVTHLVRRHPLPAMLAAFGLGVLLGRALRR
jgi:hypothetical protein